jgi:hypothetical protein
MAARVFVVMVDVLMVPVDERTRRRRRRLAQLRHASVLLGIGLIIAAVILLNQISVSYSGGHELLNRQDSSQSMLLPIGLVILGGIALAVGLR